MRHLLKNTSFPFFMTIFELFVQNSFLLKLHHYQLPPQVRSHPYYNFRTCILKYSDSICKKYQIFIRDICWKKTLFPFIFSRFYLIAGGARPQGSIWDPKIYGVLTFEEKKFQKNFLTKKNFRRQKILHFPVETIVPSNFLSL